MGADGPHLDATTGDGAIAETGLDANQDAGKDANQDAGKDADQDAGKDANKNKETGVDVGLEASVEAGAPPTTWTTLTPGGSGSYHSVVARGSVVLVGTTKGDLLRSDNGGGTFKPAYKGMGNIEEIDLDGQRAVAITGDGVLLYSLDAGVKWSSALQSCGKGATSVALAGKTVVAGCAGQRCVSTDGGVNYKCTDVKVGTAKVLFMGVAAATVNGDTVLLAAGHYSTNKVLHRWDSKSNAWADLTSILPSAGSIFYHADLASSGLAVIGSNDGKIFYSDDGGKKWSSSSPGTSFVTLQAVAATAPDLVLVGSGLKGAYLSTNGGGYFTQITATEVNQGGFTSASFDGKGGVYLAGSVLVKGVP